MTMMTERHRLPLIVPGQAQKEMFHNESLAAIDALLHPAVEAVGVDAPPTDPGSGRCWIVGPTPSGAWAGHAHALASWTGAGWRFNAPTSGLAATIRVDGLRATWDGATWTVGDLVGNRLVIGGRQVVGARGPAVPRPVGGTTVDSEARAAIDALIGLLRAHGLTA